MYATTSLTGLSANTNYKDGTIPNYPEYQTETVFGTVMLPKIYGKNLDQFEIATDGKIVLSVQGTESLYIDTDLTKLTIEASNQSLKLKPNDGYKTVEVGDHTWTSSNQFQVLSTSNSNGYKVLNPFTFEQNVTFNGDTFGIRAGEQVTIDTSNLQIAGTLEVTLPVEFNSNLLVHGTTTLEKTLSVGEATTLASTLSVTLATTLSDNLSVTGATTLSDTLSVTGATTLSDTLSVTGVTTLSDNLSVTGATTLSDTLSVTGATTLSSHLSVGGSLTVTGDLDIAGNINSISTSMTDLLVEDSTITLNSLNSDNSVLGASNLGLIIGGSNNIPVNTLEASSFYFANQVGLSQSTLETITEKKLTWNYNMGYEKLGIFQNETSPNYASHVSDGTFIKDEPYWELLGSPLHLSQNVVDQNGNHAKITFAFRMNTDEELEIVKIVKNSGGTEHRRIARFGNNTILGKTVNSTP